MKQTTPPFFGAPFTVLCLLLPALGAAGCGSEKAVPAGEAAADSQTIGEARSGEDWPKFLGPRGNGISGETGLIEKWPTQGPPVLWKKDVGAGYSAPSIRGRRLVLHHRVGDEETVECMDVSDGERIWKYGYPSDFRDPYGYNNGPRCSPLLTESRCYTYGAEGVLLCLDLESGEKVWMRDIKKDFNVYKKGSKIPNWFFGVGCTPILEGDLLITPVGGQPNAAVVAFDAESGKTVWENVGKQTWDGAKTNDPFQPEYDWTGQEMLVSYSSPFAATIHGKRHVLCLLRQGLVSLDPKDGSVNFKYWFRSRSYESVNAARPVVIDDKVFISAAYRTGSALLEINEDGQSYNELWRDRRNMQTHWSTAIAVDGYIYGFSGRHEPEATLRCLDGKTGKVAWQTTGYEGDVGDLRQDPRTGRIVDQKTGKGVPWPYYGRGSMIRIGDRFVVLGERGTLALVKVNPNKFEEICRASLPEITYPAWTAPVLSRGRLFLRDEDSLVCLDLKKPQSP